MKIFYCILFTAYCLFLNAQAPDTLWTKTYGGTDWDDGFSVQQTADSGYVVVGGTRSFGLGAWDVYFIKTDVNGDTSWTKTYGGTDSDKGYSVRQISDGGYVIAGYTKSFGAGGEDVYLLRTNANGDTLWTKTYGGVNNDNGSAIQQTFDGGYIITGVTYSFGAGDADVWLLKTDSLGDTLWTKTYGGEDWDEAISVQQTSDGGYFIVGRTYVWEVGDHDIYVIKTNANGDTLWTGTYGGTHTEFGYSGQQTTDGGYIIVGWTNSFGASDRDIYLVKTVQDMIGVEENQIEHPQAEVPILETDRNPFTDRVTIRYYIEKFSSGRTEDVVLKIYNISGQLIKQFSHLANQVPNQVIWDGSDDRGRRLPSGVYFVRLETADRSISTKIVKLK